MSNLQMDPQDDVGSQQGADEVTYQKPSTVPFDVRAHFILDCAGKIVAYANTCECGVAA